MSKKLSIIIPVYNTGQFVEACLLSCVRQNLPPEEYEIVIINDGSTDNSLQVVNRITADYSNFIVIDKSNGGASSARNAGLEVAKGKYIWFVDSDDWIETNCLLNLVSIMEKEELDALQVGFYVTTGEECSPCKDHFRRSTPVLSPKEYVLPDFFVGGSCGTIFKREIAVKHSIRFEVGLSLGEDQLFFLSIFNWAKRVRRENTLVYYYRSHPASVSSNATEEQLYQSISRIASFSYYRSFEIYCEYMIMTQCANCLNLPRRNIFRLHRVMKHIAIKRQLIYENTDWSGKRLLKFYSHFGLSFLIFHKFVIFVKGQLSHSNRRSHVQ